MSFVLSILFVSWIVILFSLVFASVFAFVFAFVFGVVNRHRGGGLSWNGKSYLTWPQASANPVTMMIKMMMVIRMRVMLRRRWWLWDSYLGKGSGWDFRWMMIMIFPIVFELVSEYIHDVHHANDVLWYRVSQVVKSRRVAGKSEKQRSWSVSKGSPS